MVSVDVDLTTSKVTILDWASAEDVGRAINPDLLKGQLQGGVAQGIGESGITPTAAIANVVYDAIGASITTLPIPPEKVLAVIESRSG